MDNTTMAQGDVFTDDGPDTGRKMDHTAILDIGVGANANWGLIPPNDGIWPDTAILINRDVTDYDGCSVDITRIMHFWLHARDIVYYRY